MTPDMHTQPPNPIAMLPSTAAEQIPKFQYNTRLQAPLGPQALNMQQQQVTLHLHSFTFQPPTSQQQQQQQQQQRQCNAAAAVLALAVGAPLRCQAVPGSSSGSNGSSGVAAVAAGERSRFGVLLWERLPGAAAGTAAGGKSSSSRRGGGVGGCDVQALEFPAWLSTKQQEPSQVNIHG